MVLNILLPANHVLFQLANICLLTSFLLNDLLLLRLCLGLAGMFFSIWGAFVLNLSIDTTVWNAVFCCINIFKCAQLLYAERPVHLHPMEEEIYLRVFKSKRVPLSRRDFKTLAKKAVVLDYEDGEAYLHQSGNVETVALILSGHVDVFDNFGAKKTDSERVPFAKINVSEAWEWVDSPQFIFNINAKVPQPAAVSLICSGPTSLCVWTLDDIRAMCAVNPQLSVCLLSVISQDCAIKILKTEKYLMSSDLVREAAHASLAESDRIRHVSSFSKLPISPKERVLGHTDSVVIEMPVPTKEPSKSAPATPSSTHTSKLSSKPSRKIGGIASPRSVVPPAGLDAETASKKKKSKLKNQSESPSAEEAVEMEPVKAKKSKFKAAMDSEPTTDSDTTSDEENTKHKASSREDTSKASNSTTSSKEKPNKHSSRRLSQIESLDTISKPSSTDFSSDEPYHHSSAGSAIEDSDSDSE
jgi:CRP-like cAMP-binding protein